MASPYMGEIKMVGETFAPTGWAQCDGQVIQTSQNEALFSLIGTIYGGNGRTTFQLPDMRGRVPIHVGQGVGLTNRAIGSRGGSETVTMSVSDLPSHTHEFNASTTTQDSVDPSGAVLASSAGGALQTLWGPAQNLVDMNNAVIADSSGGSGTIQNMQPFLAINFVIALLGVFPTQT